MSATETAYATRQWCDACRDVTDHLYYGTSGTPRCSVCWERFWVGFLALTPLERARLKFLRWRIKRGMVEETCDRSSTSNQT
jgi:hypothetical protein